jgi:hypothetical protein
MDELRLSNCNQAKLETIRKEGGRFFNAKAVLLGNGLKKFYFQNFLQSA